MEPNTAQACATEIFGLAPNVAVIIVASDMLQKRREDRRRTIQHQSRLLKELISLVSQSRTEELHGKINDAWRAGPVDVWIVTSKQQLAERLLAVYNIIRERGLGGANEEHRLLSDEVMLVGIWEDR
jgi:hypothetical protein